MPPKNEYRPNSASAIPAQGAELPPPIPDVDAFLEANQLTGLAGTLFPAHGENVPLRTALGPNGCPHFAIMLAGLAKNLQALPPDQRAAILQGTIKDTAATASSIPLPPTQKKT